MSFSTLALRAEIVSALTKLGYHEPTDVQSKVIPLALDGKILLSNPIQDLEKLQHL